VRRFAPHRDELERHRVISADGYDVVVTTVHAPHGAWLTGAYPVQQGYLVMICQPYFEAGSATEEAAMEQHEQLVRALSGAGVGIVRARRRLAARQRADQREASIIQDRDDDLAVHSPR
jgi:type IV secretory pathway protease TraF